ncbi:hypothetical protein L0F63_006386 [Massospora cicadina]|nr:hypothetical protein L0F63_006386 [Massospora cicadina]
MAHSNAWDIGRGHLAGWLVPQSTKAQPATSPKPTPPYVAATLAPAPLTRAMPLSKESWRIHPLSLLLLAPPSAPPTSL